VTLREMSVALLTAHAAETFSLNPFELAVCEQAQHYRDDATAYKSVIEPMFDMLVSGSEAMLTPPDLDLSKSCKFNLAGITTSHMTSKP
jgi:hypothetical protein